MEEGRTETGNSYYMCSKRRKLEDGEDSEISKPPSEGRKKCPIAFMPTEVITKIMSYISYDELGKSVRLVNHRFQNIAEDILNNVYKKQIMEVKALYKTSTDSIQATDVDNELRNHCKLMNMLEILIFQQSILVAVVWRYVDNTFYRIRRHCMYAGELLDQYDSFIWKFTHHPDQLYRPALRKDYDYPPEVNSIVMLTKLFCNHFEKFTEEPLNHDAFISGCKMVDILNCSKYAKKQVAYERLEEGVLQAKYSYEFSNSWFIVIPITPEQYMSWEKQQKLMYMRLRRISLAHTEMELKQSHYNREHMLRPIDSPNLPRRPNDSVYTGFGDSNDIFFYYGTMNEGSYLRKFSEEVEENGAGDEEEMNDIHEEMQDGDMDEDSESDVPFLGISLDVTLTCPIEFAPLEYLLRNEEAARSTSSGKEKNFSLVMAFQCPGASYLRLPQSFVSEVEQP